MRVAYFANLYPAPSHSFIRRKIVGLEQQGLHIERVSLRRFAGAFAEPADYREQALTHVLTESWRKLPVDLTHLTRRHPRAVPRMVAVMRELGRRGKMPLRHVPYLAMAVRLAQHLRETDVRHLHAYFENSVTIALLVHVATGIPFSFSVTGPEQFEPAELPRLQLQAERARFVAGVSQDGLEHLRRALPRHPALHLVRDMVDPDLVEIGVQPPVVEPRLVFVGRLVERKGPLLLLDALSRMKTRGQDVLVTFIGDGPLKEELMKRSGSCPVRTLFPGWGNVRDIRRALTEARGLVLPSLAEGLPSVLMEAFALGRPVVTTPVGGIPELVEAGRSGWLVPPGDVSALAQALDQMLTAPVEQLREMGAHGRARVVEQQQGASILPQLAALFRASDPTVFRKS